MFLQAEALAKYQYAYTCEISRFHFALLFILLFSIDCLCFVLLCYAFSILAIVFWLFTSGFFFQANYHCFLFCFVLYSMLFALM